MWLLSLLRGEVRMQSLAEGLRDGYVLLRVLDALAPGSVDWRRAHAPPYRPLLRGPQSMENCNAVRMVPDASPGALWPFQARPAAGFWLGLLGQEADNAAA